MMHNDDGLYPSTPEEKILAELKELKQASSLVGEPKIKAYPIPEFLRPLRDYPKSTYPKSKYK